MFFFFFWETIILFRASHNRALRPVLLHYARSLATEAKHCGLKCLFQWPYSKCSLGLQLVQEIKTLAKAEDRATYICDLDICRNGWYRAGPYPALWIPWQVCVCFIDYMHLCSICVLQNSISGIVARFEVAAYKQCVVFFVDSNHIRDSGDCRLFNIQCLHIPVRDRTPFTGTWFWCLEIIFHFVRPLEISPLVEGI